MGLVAGNALPKKADTFETNMIIRVNMLQELRLQIKEKLDMLILFVLDIAFTVELLGVI